jgi:glycosyltransferase involved in cell wall biosynthesis
MKVVMLGGYSPEKPIGGVQVHIDNLVHHLSQIDEIELYVFSFGTKSQKIKRRNLSIYVFKKWLPWHFYLPFEILILIFEILKIKPDLIHAHESCMPYSTAAAILNERYPTVLTMHMILNGWNTHSSKIGKLLGYITLKNEKYVLSHIPDIITVSSDLKRLISHVSKSEIYVVHNGVSIENVKNMPKYEFGGNVLFCIGMLEEWKGFDIIIEAISEIKKEIPLVHLLIAGSGREEQNLKKLVTELNLEQNVRFLGFVSGREKYSFYKSSDIFILPSRHDSFPIVILEAMACGKPIVASNVGAISEIVINGENGFLFEPENINDLTKKTIMLLNDKNLREKMGRLGENTISNFSWENIALQTVTVYKGIVNQK